MAEVEAVGQTILSKSGSQHEAALMGDINEIG
jgi:hypothetical protein